MRYSSRKLSNDKVITTACNFWRQIACSFQVMSGNILFLCNKIFEIPPFFQTRDLGKKVHACSVRFSALNCRRLYATKLITREFFSGDIVCVQTSPISRGIKRKYRKRRLSHNLSSKSSALLSLETDWRMNVMWLRSSFIKFVHVHFVKALV